MKKIWEFIVRREPLFVAGLAVGVALFFVIRYGTHAIVAVQALTGTGATLVFTTLRQFVTSPAGRQALTDAQADITQLPGLVADMESVKEQIGPLKDISGGLGGFVKWITDLASKKGDEIVAIAEAAKTEFEAMVHRTSAPVVAQPPTTTTTQAEVTVTPEDPELAKLQAIVGQ